MRVGILTGGGDCPGLNAVIRTVSKSLMLHQNAEIIGFRDGFLGLIERDYQTLSYADVSGILARGGTILGTHNRASPLSYFKRDGADVSDEVAATFKELELDGIVVIGGDGTMSIAHALSEKGMRFVGVPKTIDNDLMATDQTFGFDTAVAIATDALDRLQTTGQSHGRVMILETMGRYAGWIALFAGVSGGGDVILLPEIPYDIDEVAAVCRRRETRSRFTIIVVAEGAKALGGELSVADHDPTSPDPIRLGGVGARLRRELESRIESEIRVTSLGHIQRGGSPSSTDRALSSAFGAYAASLVAQGKWGHMVALQNNRLTSVPMAEVANRTKTVPHDHSMIAAALAVGTSFGAKLDGMDPTQLPDSYRLM